MSVKDFLQTGSNLLGSPLSILNLWTETAECHLGHLHLLKTADDLITLGNQVTFYVGEFPSNFWPMTEYNRREDSYKVTSHFLNRYFGSRAVAEFGPVGLPMEDIVRAKAKYANVMLSINAAQPKIPAHEVFDEEGIECFRHAYRKAWGGVESPFVAMCALFLSKKKFNGLLIAHRHAYIAETIKRFAKYHLGYDVGLLVVKDYLNHEGAPMSGGQTGAIRMQEPHEYVEHILESVTADQAERLINQCQRCFVQREKSDEEFAEWRIQHPVAQTSKEKFVEAVRGLFEAYRTTYYSAIPETSVETSQRINNKRLLEYVALTLSQGGATSLPFEPSTVNAMVDEDSERFHSHYYDPIFAAIGTSFKGYDNEPQGLGKDVVDVLIELTEKNKTTDMLLFFASRKMHRDHYVHTFNVAALGQFLLDLHVGDTGQVKKSMARVLKCETRDVEVSWWLTAMLHDHAYPLYSMMTWLQRLESLGAAYPTENETFTCLARTHIEDLNGLIHSTILNPIREAVKEKEFGLKRLWDSTKAERRQLFWFLDDDELDQLTQSPSVDHGYAAVLNIAFNLKPFLEKIRHKPLIRQIFRAILFHTTHHVLGDRKIVWGKDPLAYLLSVCDEVQEWSRRSMRDDGTLRPTKSELLLAPLYRRYESTDSWQLPAERALDMTVKYFEVAELRKWTSDHFHSGKNEIFRRLVSDPSDGIPKIRLVYALAGAPYPL